MKKASGNEEQEMRAEYDFSLAVKNPYAKRITSAIHMVVIRPEVFAAFPSEQAVNDALEGLMRSGAGAPPKAVRRRSTPAAAQGVRSR